MYADITGADCVDDINLQGMQNEFDRGYKRPDFLVLACLLGNRQPTTNKYSTANYIIKNIINKNVINKNIINKNIINKHIINKNN